MPRSSKRLCSRCNTIVDGKCPTCSVGWTTRPSRNWVPGTYNQKRWDNTRRAFLAAHPLCELCGELSEEVDHRDGCDYATQRYDWDWLRALCTPCHQKRTSAQGNAAQGHRVKGEGGQDR